MTHTTETNTATRDIDAELLALHGTTVDSAPGWRTVRMPDHSRRVEVEQLDGEHHLTTKAWAREIAEHSCPYLEVGAYVKTTHVGGRDGRQQTRRLYELTPRD